MVSVTDVVSIASSDEEHSVGSHFDYDDADANVKLVSKAGALDVLQCRTDGDGIPLVIRITPENETRDDVDGGAIETDKRENNLSNEASDKKKKKSKPKTGKSSKRNSKAKGEIDAKGVIGTLNRNITTARNRKQQLTESNTLISPTVDDVIDNLIYTCDPLFEADYEGACVNLLQLDVGNEDPTERDDDTDESDDQFQSKIDRILSNEKDDVQNYDEFDMNGISALIKQKRETDDLVLSKGLIDAKLQETKVKLSDAMDGMKQLQRNNDELNEKVQRLETILSKKDKKAAAAAEHAMRKEQEMSQNYMRDIDIARSTIEHLKEERHNDLSNHRKAMTDVTFMLEEEKQKNDELTEEILLLKQQLIAERSNRYCIEELIQEKDDKNEKLSSELHQKERYCFELEQTMKMTKKGMKKDYEDLQKFSKNLSYKLASSKEKLKRSRREKNELQFRLERLNNSLRMEANTKMKFEEEGESNLDLESGIDDDLFLNRQSQRMERLKSIMS
eukprot:scaffold1165_cov126-Skeletonema_dohrnii-CCMP3373.AAC.13